MDKHHFHWMPAAHDSYPGYDWITSSRSTKWVAPSSAVRKSDDARIIRVYKYGTSRITCGKYTSDRPEAASETVFDLHTEERRLPYIMFNANDAPRTSSGSRHKLRTGYVKRGHTIFQDSGGFQLYSGASEFVDPHTVAEMHIRYATEGVGLDVPLGFLPALKLAVPAARVQAWNNKLIQKTYGGPLFVTSHGAYSEGRILYLQELLRLYGSDIDHMCIAALRPVAGVFNPTLAQIAAHLLYVLHNVKAKRIHILGVSTFGTLVLAAAAARVYDRAVTADSSRHIMIGASGSTLNPYLKAIAPGGNRAKGNTRDLHVDYIDTCNCQFCSKLCYNFPMQSSRILSTHALRSLARAQRLVREAADNYLNDIQMPFIPGMLKAVRILQGKKAEAQDVMLAVSKTRKPPPLLFEKAESKSPEKRITAVLETYARFHKKRLTD